ncbi:unnamed protein product [Clonostachys byssicola]|uniref:Protein MAK11 n=1 Tax=Clonostachys byssicola TaxID=160290 RepID=A0A9N9UQF7_9HYPO|nr:unnamed protein product [Clonostachys byssicola]
MAKRKRQNPPKVEAPSEAPATNKKQKPETTAPTKTAEPTTTSSAPSATETLQIVLGSYDRVLHGLTATVGAKNTEKKKNKKKQEFTADFADTFLLTAHTSPIRCVAVSPASAPSAGQMQKVFLASGSADEKINLYELSAHPPKKEGEDQLLATIAPRPILENPRNREMGALLHHTSTVTALRFPTRSKLLSASDDSTIGVTRTRDWSLLSSIKAPKPNVFGRPSGDTAVFGGAPSGVNDFAIHPSMKLMISVSKGERSMRLWNLMTGKKAGVLNFERNLLQEIGEGRHSTGEGLKVTWGNVDGADEFAVGFSRDIVVFGMDSTPKCRVMPDAKTKIHKFEYLTLDEEEEEPTTVIAVATEDGRIAFFSTAAAHITKPTDDKAELSTARLIGHVGGKDDKVSGRIKDFSLVRSETDADLLYIIGGSSDGVVRLWTASRAELKRATEKPVLSGPIGKLVASYETQNRITCMAAYLMIPLPEGAEESEYEVDDSEDSEADSEDDGEST